MTEASTTSTEPRKPFPGTPGSSKAADPNYPRNSFRSKNAWVVSKSSCVRFLLCLDDDNGRLASPHNAYITEPELSEFARLESFQPAALS